MDHKYCMGCYNNDYNHGLGGAKECWSLKDARLILRRRVGMDDVPPWTAKPATLPNCYHQQGCIFVDPTVSK